MGLFRLFSRKTSNENDQINCPKCGRYLGVRKDLIATGLLISKAMQEERTLIGKEHLKGTAIFGCPGCHHLLSV